MRDPSPELMDLLRSREARGLRVPAVGRMLFLGLALLMVLSTVFFVEPPMVSPLLGGVLCAVLAGMLAFNTLLLVRLGQERSVEAVGLVGAAADAVFVIVLALLGIAAGAEDGLSPAYMLETELPAAIVTVVAINGLALRPRYPAVVGAGAVIAILIPCALAVLDPSTPWSTDRAEVYAGASVEPWSMGTVVLMVTGTAAAVVFAARAARQTVIEGIERQLEHSRLQQAQLRIVMQEKVQTLRKLVAGVCHEVNSPLGAVKSSAHTLERLLDKLDGDSSHARYVRAGRQSLSTIDAATARLSALETSLRSLSHLDEAEMQPVDLDHAVEEVVEAARRSLGSTTEVVTRLGGLPELVLDGAQIKQALLTLVTNALEAAGAEGTVTVTTLAEADAVEIEVRDDGPGLAPDALARIFDVSLSGRGQRVAVGLGLAAAQNAAHRHGGLLEVNSRLGEGARFVLRLPRTPADPSADGLAPA